MVWQLGLRFRGLGFRGLGLGFRLGWEGGLGVVSESAALGFHTQKELFGYPTPPKRTPHDS